MDFLNLYKEEVLNKIEEEINKLEIKIIRKGIWATKKEKKRLERLETLYYEKLCWYERQLDIELTTKKI
jgi:hypothetical protein